MPCGACGRPRANRARFVCAGSVGFQISGFMAAFNVVGTLRVPRPAHGVCRLHWSRSYPRAAVRCTMAAMTTPILLLAATLAADPAANVIKALGPGINLGNALE